VGRGRVWRLVGRDNGVAVGSRAALLVAGYRIVRSRAVVGGIPGPAGGLAEDLPLPRAVRDRPWRLSSAAAIAATVAITLGAWHAERSPAEGLQRGPFAGLLVVAAFAVLGRVGGARPSGPG
jgi:hypothetical protein